MSGVVLYSPEEARRNEFSVEKFRTLLGRNYIPRTTAARRILSSTAPTTRRWPGDLSRRACGCLTRQPLCSIQ